MSRWSMAVIVALLVGPGCGGEPPPAEIRGTWATDHPDYAGRTMVIGPDSVAFEIGTGADARRTAHAIHDVAVETDEVVVRYGPGGRSWSLRTRLLGDGVLVLVNQPAIRWTRLTAAGDSARAVTRP